MIKIRITSQRVGVLGVIIEGILALGDFNFKFD